MTSSATVMEDEMNLKPCPFCGGSDLCATSTLVVCMTCGGGAETKEMWNTRADDALKDEVARLRRTVIAASNLGEMIGFLSGDEARVAAFLDELGEDLISRARAALAPRETPTGKRGE